MFKMDGRSNGQPTKFEGSEDKFGTSKHEFTLNLVQRTRIAKGVNDFGVFLPQTPHFAIGIESPQGSTIKQHCAERIGKIQFS